MPISAVNFGRWLDRLGFKHTEQPTFSQSVTPVSLVQDQSQLVSLSLGPSGVVGCTMPLPAVGEFGTVQFFGPSPAEIGLVLGLTGTGDFAVSIGADGSTLAALTGAATLPMQIFQGGGDIRVQRGSVVAAPSADVPTLRVPTSLGTVNRFIKPAGGWMQVSARAANTIYHIAAWIYEHPTENAQ